MVGIKISKRKDTRRLNWFNETVWLAGYFLELRPPYYVCVSIGGLKTQIKKFVT